MFDCLSEWVSNYADPGFIKLGLHNIFWHNFSIYLSNFFNLSSEKEYPYLPLPFYYTPAPLEGVYCFTSVRPSVLPSVQDIFFSNYWWQKSDIWSQASYRYAILWEAFLDPSDSYFLFADLVGFYTHLTYMHIFRHIFLSNYWWQKSDIWSQASYGYPISWEVFLDPSDSYFLFVDFVDFYTHWTYILYMGDFQKKWRLCVT
jgi:hypothetical protein